MNTIPTNRKIRQRTEPIVQRPVPMYRPMPIRIDLYAKYFVMPVICGIFSIWIDPDIDASNAFQIICAFIALPILLDLFGGNQ